MKDKERMARLYVEIEVAFSKLKHETKETLSDAEWGEVQHFIDVGEYGLALETFVGILAEEKKELKHPAVAIVKDLAAAMGYDTAGRKIRLVLLGNDSIGRWVVIPVQEQ